MGRPSTCCTKTPGATALQAADDYEVDEYARVKVPLLSGGTAWVYVSAAQAPEAASTTTSGG
jgi:hypothetical protein